MKTKRITLLSVTMMALSLPLESRAQETASNNTVPAEQAPPPGPHGPMAGLSEQERAQLKAAHDKAIQQNPSVEQALKEAHQSMEKARKALREAMVAADPSIAPILEKFESRKHCPGEGKRRAFSPENGKERGNAALGTKEWKHHGPPPGMANLTEQERNQLRAAHEQIKNDPSIVAARQALRSAATPEARRAAHEALRQASDAALLKADPSLGPILEKLHQAGPPPQGDNAAPNGPETMSPFGMREPANPGPQ